MAATAADLAKVAQQLRGGAHIAPVRAAAVLAALAAVAALLRDALVETHLLPDEAQPDEEDEGTWRWANL